MHKQLYLAVSHIYGSRFRCLNMVKMYDANNSDLKDTGIASLNRNIKLVCFVIEVSQYILALCKCMRFVYGFIKSVVYAAIVSPPHEMIDLKPRLSFFGLNPSTKYYFMR